MVPSDINLLGFSFHLYSLFFALGLLTAYLISLARAKSLGFDEKLLDNITLVAIIFGLIGARSLFVISNWPRYENELLELFKFWQGGLSFYGGLIGGFLGIATVWLWQKFSFLKLFDLLSPGLALGQAIGRFGNFFNQEAYGRPTDLPWGIYISPEARLPGFENFAYFHPTFFYEALGLGLLFLVLSRIKSSRVGLVFGVYAVSSGLLRAVVENLRLDNLQIGSLKVSLTIAIVLVATGCLILAKLYGRKTT